MSKFTPGKWNIDRFGDIVDENGGKIMLKDVPIDVRYAVHDYLRKNTAFGIVEDFLRSQSKTKTLPFIDGYLNGVFDEVDDE